VYNFCEISRILLDRRLKKLKSLSRKRKKRRKFVRIGTIFIMMDYYKFLLNLYNLKIKINDKK